MKNTIHLALLEAGKILLESFGKITEYTEKESQSSIVTQTDINSERRIFQIISNEFPNHNLLGEETGFQDKHSEYTWVVDPLDGTSNFAAGLPWFGVIICVLKKFEPVLAGCFLPFYNQLYFAEKGKGATLNNQKINVSKETHLKNILLSYSLDFSFDSRKTERESRVIKHLVQNVRNLRSTNCLLDLCYTADGKFGACINQSTKIWDIAGTGLIIEEAGGKVTDLDGSEQNYSINKNNYDRNFTIVGSNKILHSKIISIINN
ncbi:MAG: inositol monophosphatase [Prolixibacteraceae bacterium]|jgi:myo-inositol-1(or 4)-monophosphatase|nr:inositol monophosphatase [Prolixibacteraceae bacterium]MBT6004778.1 inositol monophosphatase [Prolixibacteraceae bacterium]MBT6764284.1 inositol monophosphatase [Prolixibacteraceae bacterium]MBT6999248.1 inositol monophosphatase [Prolixibacteraceae bacterium]MBT7393269.1 inositol monophosphatase [Prolixibacteraceae bacterium]